MISESKFPREVMKNKTQAGTKHGEGSCWGKMSICLLTIFITGGENNSSENVRKFVPWHIEGPTVSKWYLPYCI